MNCQRGNGWTLRVVLLGLLVAAIPVVSGSCNSEPDSQPGFLPTNPARGGELFLERGCSTCHAVPGAKGNDTPDLARARRAPSSLHGIAAAMWNHAPQMWDEMASRDSSIPTLTPREFVDVVGFLLTVGYLEEEGDPVRGQILFSKKGCGDCHGNGESETKIGADLARWTSKINAMLLVQLLWNHAPAMEESVQEKGLAWPQISPSEVADLLAFLRSMGTHSSAPSPLPGDPWVGRFLFRNHCQGCHRAEEEGGEVGPDLGASSAPRTLSALAASLWSHVPAMDERMKELKVERPSFTEQEMADLVTYLFAIRYREAPGDRVAGAKVYRKTCRQCHGERGEGDGGPSLLSLGARSSVPFMASTLWNHGPSMFEQMKERGLEWPILRGDEMSDLIQYLRSLSSES